LFMLLSTGGVVFKIIINIKKGVFIGKKFKLFIV